MADAAISIQNLTFRYRGQKRPTLDDISLEIPPGDFLVVMGPSEAGKSTLAATMNGLIPHFFKGKFQGNVTVFGRQTRDARVAELSEQVGIVFQDFEAQLFSTRVDLDVAFGPENFCLPRSVIGQRIQKNLERVGLMGLRHRPPSTLSGGQKQKLAIASVLAMDPKILVMDEPTTDLDPASKAEIFRIVGQLAARRESTLIVIEYDIEEILQARHVLLLQEGKNVLYGPAEEVLLRVDLLEKVGVRPPGVPKYFQLMGAQRRPLTLDDGYRQFMASGWSLDEEKVSEINKKDAGGARCGEAVIHCEGLEYVYPGGFNALRGIDLEIRQGEMVALIGQNGSGKTTLAKHFNGLLLPTAGRALVKGQDTRRLGVFELGKIVGYVFQNPDHQIFSETVFQEVAFTLRLRKFPEGEVKKRVTEALEAVGLLGWEKENPFVLTKSGRQRVAVASILAARPDVLILDEPTTGLDYSEQRRMMELLRRLNEQGHTIIFITHHLWVAAEYAHWVIALKDGGIFLQDTPREVLSRERELRKASLVPPQIIRLSNQLGKTMLTADELAFCTKTPG